MHKWIDGDRSKCRVGEILLRVAHIQSSVNGDPEITRESFACTRKFADWQMAIRRVYRTGLAENTDGRAFEDIANALQAQSDKQQKTGKFPKGAEDVGDLRWAQIMNSKSLYRKHGSPLINRIKQSMAHEGRITIIYETDDEGKPTKISTPFVRMRCRIR